MNAVQKAAFASAGAFSAHLLLDTIPHGFIARPATLFKETLPTLAELLPGLLILIFSVWLFDNALLFCIASSCGILPDVITTLYYKKKKIIVAIPLLPFIHTLHRRVHWFESEPPEGSFASRFPNGLLLVCEALFTSFILFALFN